MKPFYKILAILVAAIITLYACQDEYGNRKESEPIIENASVSPVDFTFGDSIQLKATIIDKATTLSMLYYEVYDNDKVLSKGQIPLGGETHEVHSAIHMPLVANQTDNADIIVRLTAKNILKSTTQYEIKGIKGKRPVYKELYLVTDEGGVITLKPETAGTNKYVADNMTLATSFRYKIAQKLNPDQTINYQGAVFGNVNGKLSMIDEKGESSFLFLPNADYTKSFSLDLQNFNVQAKGSKLDKEDFSLTNFENIDIEKESFQKLTRNLEKNKTYALFGKLADKQNIYNPDFFERISDNQVKFLRESGKYTIYYNPVRKNIIIGVDNPSYPQYLLACGWGLGYPTQVSSATIGAAYAGKKRTHTDWGFDNILKYVLLPQIAEGIYQGTFYTPDDKDHYAGFKPFENTGWGNEKKAGTFKFTGLSIIKGEDNWEIPNGATDPVIESANYRFTINLNTKTVNIEKVKLQ